MKNLEVLELLHKPLNCSVQEGAIFGQTSDTTYFISGNILYKHDFETGTLTDLCPHSIENVNLLKVLTIENKICIVTRDSIEILDFERDQFNNLSFESNIAAVSWNPTEKIVAIVYCNGDVATYSIDYENGQVFPQGRSTVGAKIPDTVYVGWGSTDAQLRGSEGKLTKQTPAKIKPVEDKRSTISWRGNGEMFVVNYWEESKRKFIVFETPCTALFRSEECPGLQAPVAWRPAGNMITAISEIDDRQNVVIFEKNGQRRFNFELDFDVMVKSVKWSPCAQILTLHTHDSVTQTQSIYLLTSSNYKWYVKQTLIFCADNPLMDFEWLESTHFTYTLRVATRLQVMRYTFRHVISHSSGVCCVIDGNTVNVTDLNDSVIPPIMSLKQMTNSCNINFVTFCNDCIVTCDCENNLKILDFDGNVKNSVNMLEMLDAMPFPLAYHHFSITGSDLYLVAETSNNTTIVFSVNLETIKMSCMWEVSDPVRFLTVVPDVNHHIHGFKKVHTNIDMFVDDDSQTTVYQNVTKINNNIYTCRHMSNCHFYVNDSKVNDCVISFAIFDTYLLYTTKMNELHCVRLDAKSLSDSYVRRVERGAAIVAPISTSPKIVLQLPRDRLLNQNKWEEAFTFVRLEKLNVNLLFDLGPERFLGQVDRFVKGAKTINQLNSACLEFQSDNVLDTLYNTGKVESLTGKVGNYPKKMQAILGAILKFIDSCDYANYISTIMIINVHFFTVSKALIYLQDLLRRSSDDVTLKQKLIDAVNTLMKYGCKKKKLYTDCLLLYDFDLALFVATCCQLDPKVYEAQMNNLRNLPEVQRRYEINVFGKRPKSAIAYLLRCPEVDSETVLSFVKKHQLLQVAYENCPPSNRHHPTLARTFAKQLSRYSSSGHQQAGVILKSAGLPKEALEEFKLSHNWREVVNLLGELEVEKVERVKVLNEMAGKLCKENMIKDAAILYEYYAGSYEMAVKILLENSQFQEATHIAKKHKRSDIIVSEVVPLLKKRKTHLDERLAELNDTYDKHRLRLAQVRRAKFEKYGNVDHEDDGRGDLFSPIGSQTYFSWRSRRAKKEQGIKKGGFYGDIALIKALHVAIKEIYTKGEEVKTCCSLLLQESDMRYKELKRLYDLYWKIVDNVRKGIGEIWPPHYVAGHKTQDLKELSDLENFEHLGWEYRTPPTEQSSWRLLYFDDVITSGGLE